ncbi:peptidase U32 family protein [Clostridium cochlearium]|jgi:putative protease|uniref:Protease n=1 Tax=Clostridium cochlearium TaxID=1494 RepID=A0ABY0QHN7_CLOCO|nr:U32 family peptidase [Clostridium cochlearium]MBV1816931.1 U32 family peptidase [Bacteroidales bacterium MSK.15.36]NSJ90725.1 U32 family peptidase [Coprococcus sp. MSK.21.13]MBE6064177.1 U32 family peptidase [Clostridium cochlearium]MBU5269374.1 U32 family peptidase [Clostridium cochlearium]MCG4571067.1 U32 family peptidase [Clostridium cochlearium]
MNKPEILAPAGNLEKLKTAILFGADAVYLGGSKLNLRAFADNFSDKELIEGIEFAHSRGKRVYVTVNVFPHNEDLEELEPYLKDLENMKVDAIIVSDPGIIMTAKEVAPKLEIHLSTQANNVNWKSALFWYKQGVKRIVLARELSFEEIKEMREKLPQDCELEAFVHGSMCMSYSGRCLLSNYMTGRDANRGECAQPCRYKYYLMEEKREGQYFPVFQDERGTYILNSKDLCMIKHIPELVESGINSFKIEGRMKSSYYVASVVKSYRQALDAYLENSENYKFNEDWMNNLLKTSHRDYYTGFYFGDKDSQIYETSSYIRNYDIVGIVKDYNKETKEATIEQRNKLFDGDLVEILRPVGNSFEVKLEDLHNEEGEKIESTPVAQMIYKAKVNTELKKDDMLIKAK